MKLLVYIGFHKTGTTFLQTSLRKTAIERQNSYYKLPNGWELTDATDVLDSRHRIVRLLKTGDDYSAALKDLRKQLLSRKTNVLLSNENYMGDQFGQDETGVLYPHAKRSLAFFKELENDFDVSFVFSVRNQVDFIKSTFLNLVRDNAAFSFPHYCEGLKLETLDYAAFFEMAARQIDHPISVIPFETIRFNPQDFLNAFAKLMGGDLKIVPSDDKRPSFSALAVEIAKLAFKEIESEKRILLGNFLSDHFSGSDLEKPLLIPTPIQDILKAHFAERNKRLFADWIPEEHQNAIKYWI